MVGGDLGQVILAEMRNVNGRLDRLDSSMATLNSRMGTVEVAVADLSQRVRSLPDMHFLAATATVQLTHSKETKAALADMKVRLDEIYQSMATDPEINNLRAEVARFRDQSVDVDVRLGTIEGRLGLESSHQPR